MRGVAATEWRGCYDESWRGMIVPEAYAHPAKFARGLIKRIILHGQEKNYWRPGELLADCFAGVGCGGIVAAYLGYAWVGCELEETFCRLAEANFELHRRKWEALGAPMPRIVRGDSRRFAEIVGECAAIVASPPYENSVSSENPGGIDWGKAGRPDRLRGTTAGVQGDKPQTYGNTDGQIGSLPAGDLAGVIASPPYVSGGHHPDQTGAWGGQAQSVPKELAGYGEAPGQIGRLPAGDVQGIIASPPYAELGRGGPDHRPDRCESDSPAPKLTRDAYGATDGQIGRLPAGDVAGIVASPPFEGVTPTAGDPKYAQNRKTSGGPPYGDYGSAPGQLGNQSGPNYWEAVRDVYAQAMLALRPQGVMALVVKAYVRDGALVDLPGDTWRLLLSLGFEPLERVHAMLTRTSRHRNLFGDDIEKETARKSFFRRLAEAHGSPRIDWESVLFVKKP